MSRKKSAWVNCAVIILLSLPALLGNNLWSSFQPLKPGSTILDLEDFLVSNNIMPLGSLVYVMFCCLRGGWGWDQFELEANTGKGLRFPKSLRVHMTFILPIIILYVFVMGYMAIF